MLAIRKLAIPRNQRSTISEAFAKSGEVSDALERARKLAGAALKRLPHRLYYLPSQKVDAGKRSTLARLNFSGMN